MTIGLKVSRVDGYCKRGNSILRVNLNLRETVGRENLPVKGLMQAF